MKRIVFALAFLFTLAFGSVAQSAPPLERRPAEDVMIAAFSPGGEYLAYTEATWSEMTDSQRAGLTFAGVQLSFRGHTYIVAPRDTIGSGCNWGAYGTDIPGLPSLESAGEARNDFDGKRNSQILLSYGRNRSVPFPAAQACDHYYLASNALEWYLPAAGELDGIYSNKDRVNFILEVYGGRALEDKVYWSSTEHNETDDWAMDMRTGYVTDNNKADKGMVRPVAQIPVTPPIERRSAEDVMIAAFTREGAAYRAYTETTWSGMSDAQRNLLIPVGVQLNYQGHKYIVALTDASENGLEWGGYGTDIPGLRNYDSETYGSSEQAKAAAKGDFNGKSNTQTILSYGRSNGVAFPAAQAAANYRVAGANLSWYLPSFGELWGISRYKNSINRLLRQCGGGAIRDIWYWSSTEQSTSFAWYVLMVYGNIYNYTKYYNYRVRPCAPVPVSSAM